MKTQYRSPKFEAIYIEEEPGERSSEWVIIFNDGYGNCTTIKKIYSDVNDARPVKIAADFNKSAGFY